MIVIGETGQRAALGVKLAEGEKEALRELLERCRSGETGAMEELYRRYFPTVYRWAFRLAGPGADMEDICHEVFIAVYSNLKNFKGDSSFSTWLYGVTRYTISYYLRKKKILKFFNFGGDSREEEIPSLHKSPLQSAEEREATQAIYDILDKLPKDQREVFVLFELEEMTGEEISELLGVNVNTVFSKLYHARKKIRRIMEQRKTLENY